MDALAGQGSAGARTDRRRRKDTPTAAGARMHRRSRDGFCYSRARIGWRGQFVVLTPFHVAVQVRDIAEARRFYTEVLGCSEGRSARDWVDFNMFGHQFVCHLNPALGRDGRIGSHFNPVDGQGVPVPHCGVVLEASAWAQLAARLKHHPVDWVIEPYTRFRDAPGEQSTLFIRDPSGNALEFKSFRDITGQLFAK
jgi:extradiol dioxygenase family protein